MATNKTDIYVYAHWFGLAEPMLLGVLSAHQAKGRKDVAGYFFNPIKLGIFLIASTEKMDELLLV